MNIITFIMGIFTALLIGAQFNAYIPLPACWGIVVIIGLFILTVKNSTIPKSIIKAEIDEEDE